MFKRPYESKQLKNKTIFISLYNSNISHLLKLVNKDTFTIFSSKNNYYITFLSKISLNWKRFY